MVILEHDSLLPEERVVNTYSMSTSAGTDLDDINEWHAALNTLYQAIDIYLSATLSGAMTIKSYLRSDPIPRVPVLETTHTITPGTTSLPGEVAICVSFQAVRAVGEPQARRRGRVFLGPLSESANTSGLVSSTVRSGIATAFDTFLTAIKLEAWDWDVWSQRDNQNHAVDNGWVDNSFDTIRSRGTRSTARSTFS